MLIYFLLITVTARSQGPVQKLLHMKRLRHGATVDMVMFITFTEGVSSVSIV